MSFNLTSSYATAAVNTDVYVNVAATTHQKTIKQILWSLSADPAAAVTIEIESPVGTRLSTFYVTKGGPGFLNFGDKGLPCANAGAVQVLLNLAATSGCIGTLTVLHDVE